MVEINLRENKDSLLRRIGKRLPMSADMLESDEEFLVLINAPGCDEDSIDLRFVGGNIKVRAERDEEYEGYTLVSEGRPRRIAETVPVPADVDVDGASATYENGVLRVRLPKTEEATETEEAVEDETDGYREVGVTEAVTETDEEREDEAEATETEDEDEETEEAAAESEEDEEDDEETSEQAEAESEEEDGEDGDKEADLPSSHEELEEMSYRDLQGVAKKLDIKANQSTEALVDGISDELDL